jgi:hypothetical protein
MNWFDIIKEDEFEPQSGEFPGTTSEAIAEELSNDNVKITFNEKLSNFELIISHSEFGTIYEYYGIRNLSTLTTRVEQAKKYIKLIDEILEVFRNKIKEKELYSNNGVRFVLVPYEGSDTVELTVVFWSSDSDLAFIFDNGNWEYLSEGRSFENMWNYFTKKFKYHIKKLGE